MNIQQLFTLESQIREKYQNLTFLDRSCYREISTTARIVGLVGLRGVGKTAYLLQQRALTPKSLYISCDTIFLHGEDFLGLIDRLIRGFGITTFFLDEIHFLQNWSQILKNIHDFYDVRVVFSGSSMISIVDSSYDLSRRVLLFQIPHFRYSEYLQLQYQIQTPIFSLSSLLDHHTDIARELFSTRPIEYFHEYFFRGQFGFSYESPTVGEYQYRLSNSLKKSIYEDISQHIDISSSRLTSLEHILSFIARYGTSQIALSTLVEKIHLSSNTISEYLGFLHRLGWIRMIHKYGNLTDRLRKQQKIYFSNTNSIYPMNPDIEDSSFRGNLRETFFLDALSTHFLPTLHTEISYESRTDFILSTPDGVSRYEIGGRNKKRGDQDIWTIRDDIQIGEGREIPLWLFGLLA